MRMHRTFRPRPRQSVPSSRRSARLGRKTRLASWSICGLSILTSVCLGTVAVQHEHTEARNAEARATYSPPVSLVAANEEITRFAVVGDSTTEGNSLDINGGRPGGTSWVYYAQSNTTRFVGGWADSGAQTKTIAENFEPVKGTEVLVILAGQNDTRAGVPFSKITNNLRQVVKAAGNVRVLVSSVLPQDDMPEKATEYNDRLRAYTQKQGWLWVDAAAGVRNGDRYKKGLTEDGIHPTTEGAKILGNILEDAIKDAGNVKFSSASESVSRLADTSKPWTMTVMGDSTGNETTEWVHLVTRRMAQYSGRPATIHTWNVETNTYDSAADISGVGEPIIVWNGSASGESAKYSLEHSADLAPERPDLLVVNHGHNQWDGDRAETEIDSILDWAKDAWDVPPALAITLQNPKMGDRADAQEQIVKRISETWAGKDDIVIIDVHAAFMEAGNLETLMRDEVHPNEHGSQLWAETVWQELDFDRLRIRSDT